MLYNNRPFYHETYHGKDKYELKKLILGGIRPYLDERYNDPSRSSGVGFIEYQLARVMKDCWESDPHDRPSMADVLRFLQTTLIEAKKRGDLEPSDQIEIDVAMLPNDVYDMTQMPIIERNKHD